MGLRDKAKEKTAQQNQVVEAHTQGNNQNNNNAPAVKQKTPQQQQIELLSKALEKNSDQFLKVLASSTEVERFKREVLTLLRGDPSLLMLEPASILGCAIQSAQMGLSLDRNLGHAYIIPYKGKATYQIGYLGLLELARRSGQIMDIFAEVVWEGDEFSQKITQRGVEFLHVPCPPSQRGKRIGVYMLALLTNGGRHYGFMYAEEVEKIRSLSHSQHKPDSIWNLHTDTMWKKTVIKREAKFLPFSTIVMSQINAEDRKAPETEYDGVILEYDEKSGEVHQTEKLPSKMGGNQQKAA
ncbi:MAG: recombinase RecT [Epsilonproteobacteria bacterium]|nr:recombinase RecT [Campylobacterota bacterium]